MIFDNKFFVTLSVSFENILKTQKIKQRNEKKLFFE